MPSLKSIPDRLPRAPDRLPRLTLAGPDRDRTRRAVMPWRSWYNTKRWMQLRWSVLKDALFTCARCARVEGDTSLLVADHIRPHRGDETLFWDRGNLQCLCRDCHSRVKQREEAAALARGGA